MVGKKVYIISTRCSYDFATKDSCLSIKETILGLLANAHKLAAGSIITFGKGHFDYGQNEAFTNNQIVSVTRL